MSERPPALSIATAPFFKGDLSTRALMGEVLLATLPAVAAAVWFFGIGALLVVLAATGGAVLVEWLCATDRRSLGCLRDGSAVLTGVLLALTLPPSIPLWMAALGGAVGMGLGKTIWGGLGQNLFNPALVGRAFLQAAFPTTLTTWVAPAGGWLEVNASSFAFPFASSGVDVVTAATPLGLAKFESTLTELPRMLMGNTGGCLGETSSLILILCGLWLGLRRAFDWRLPVSTLLTVGVASGVLHLFNATYPGPSFMLLSGGLLFGAVFMVTDPVTTPITPRGAWIFGLGVGLLVVLIRLFGGLPEGVMYAILLMNSVTPLINRFTQPKIFGA